MGSPYYLQRPVAVAVNLWALDERESGVKCPGSIWLNGGGANTDVIVKMVMVAPSSPVPERAGAVLFVLPPFRQSNGGAALMSPSPAIITGAAGGWYQWSA